MQRPIFVDHGHWHDDGGKPREMDASDFTSNQRDRGERLHSIGSRRYCLRRSQQEKGKDQLMQCGKAGVITPSRYVSAF